MKILSTGWVMLLAAVVLTSACGGGSSQRTSTANREHARLEYSYPYDTQQEVPVRAPVALRFSHPLTDTAPETAVQWQSDDGEPVLFSSEQVDGGRGLLLTPEAPLQPGTGYRLTMDTVATTQGPARVPQDGIRFRTRAAIAGGREATGTGDGFELKRMIPDGDTLPVMDFSSFRLQFSQPLARDSIRYGDTVSVVDEQGALVPMIVLVKGPYLTLDPGDDLKPGERYTFSLGSQVRSIWGEPLASAEFSHVAQDSAPREIMVQRAADSGQGSIVSPLTGAPINAVPINALLLGERSSSQQQGDIHAELAFVPDYPDVTPLRVPRGSLLRGSSVAVEIAGEVPAGFETGEISVRFVSDAAGFLLPNPYTQAEDSPRHVHLLMDVAMTAENTTANGALSQDLLHVELAGTAIVEDGVLVINAIGIVEPQVLGLEQAWGVLSFRLEAYADQEQAPAPETDSEPPVLQSWSPGENVLQASVGDPVILNFSEALDPDSLAGAIEVHADGVPVDDLDWYLDGASVVLRPDGGLAYGTAYEIHISDGITDLAGNPLAPETLSFTTATYVGSGDRAPFAITAYPGFPCAVAPGSQDLAGNIQGSCLSKDGTGGDVLPVTALPANRAIRVRFSQAMAADSIVLGESCNTGTFRVERVSATGECEAVVAGDLQRSARELRFEPASPWEPGVLYRYVLASDSAPQCGQNAICAAFGAPLQTAMLRENAELAGGPPMAIHFRGAPPTEQVLQPLSNLPAADVNANFRLEAGEQGAVESPPGSGVYPTPANATQILENGGGGLVGKVNVGCGFSGIEQSLRSCPGEKFIYLTGGLDVDIIGWDEQEGAVKVAVYPTLLMASSLSVHATILLVPQEIPTGPQVMRLRYEADDNGQRTQPITGWIRDSGAGPVFEATLDLFLDAPYLHPPLSLPHNLHNYALDGVQVSGPISFLNDGRMQIEQVSLGALPINVSIASGAATVRLLIPEGGINLTYISAPIKQ